jgi:hypothetical protein
MMVLDALVSAVPPEMVATVVDKSLVKEAWDAISSMCISNDRVKKAAAQQVRSGDVQKERDGGGFCSLSERHGGDSCHLGGDHGGAQGRGEDSLLRSGVVEADRTRDLDSAGCGVTHRGESGRKV